MTRHLYLLRHAKSDWGDVDAPDHGRVLSPRGLRGAKALANHLKRSPPKVERIFCSTARRARETLQVVHSAFGAPPLTFRRQLYLAAADDLLEFVRKLPSRYKSVVIIGHNPGFHELALALMSHEERGKKRLRAKLEKKFPTGTLCELVFDIDDWSGVKPGRGRLNQMIRPRDVGVTS
ncbi:MAG: histidine phosphatase family protein [Rhodobacteraceae bacterium]|nr:histidine phosphatase family protein [Paracoccaceae bacterium]